MNITRSARDEHIVFEDGELQLTSHDGSIATFALRHRVRASASVQRSARVENGKVGASFRIDNLVRTGRYDVVGLTNTNEAADFGKAIGEAVDNDTQRLIARWQYNAGDRDLFAGLYVTYTRAGLALVVSDKPEDIANAVFGITHVQVDAIQYGETSLIIDGAAILAGVDSHAVTPRIGLGKPGTDAYVEFAAERRSKPAIHNNYAIGSVDYTESGFRAVVDFTQAGVAAIATLDRIDALIVLEGPDGVRHTAALRNLSSAAKARLGRKKKPLINLGDDRDFVAALAGERVVLEPIALTVQNVTATSAEQRDGRVTLELSALVRGTMAKTAGVDVLVRRKGSTKRARARIALPARNLHIVPPDLADGQRKPGTRFAFTVDIDLATLHARGIADKNLARLFAVIRLEDGTSETVKITARDLSSARGTKVFARLPCPERNAFLILFASRNVAHLSVRYEPFRVKSLSIDELTIEKTALQLSGLILLNGVDFDGLRGSLCFCADGQPIVSVDAQLKEAPVPEFEPRQARYSGTLDLARAATELGSDARAFSFELHLTDRRGFAFRVHLSGASPNLTVFPDGSIGHFKNIPRGYDWRLQFGRVSGRLQLSRKASRISHVQIDEVKKSGNTLVVVGAAIAAGIDSKELQPFIVARKRHSEEELAIPAKRALRRDLHKIFSTGEDLTTCGFRAEIDVAALEAAGMLDHRFIDFHVRLQRGANVQYSRRLAHPTRKLRKYGHEDICIFPNVRPEADVFAYLTKDVFGFSLMYREKLPEDQPKYVLREYLATALFYLAGGREGREWLMYETYSSTAQDNSFVFFEWMRRNRPEQPVYYVIRSDSPDVARLKPYGRNVLPYYGIRHLFHLLRSHLLVASQGRYHVFKFRPLNSIFKRHLLEKKLVFLQHGVTAFKRSAFSKRDPSGSADLLITVSDREKSIVKKYWHYPDREVAVTGFPRFDVLQNKATPQKRMILVMPTWRSWLDGATFEQFEASDFCNAYRNLLNDPALIELAETEDLEIVFYLHIKLLQYISLMKPDSPRVRVVALGDEPVNEMLMRASVLVTDYSSVAWDFHYMKKPVVFFHFDLDKYLNVHGSFINLKKGLFGPHATTAGKLVPRIAKAILKPPAVRVDPKNFKYNDRLNCERVYEAIADRFIV